jgi:spore coat polysaccharide biosynthesis protein SpsF
MKIPIILQARVGSKRLPSKSLLKILGKPLIFYAIQNLKASEIGPVILAVPDTKENETLCEIAKQQKIECIRGSEKDVLARYMLAAEEFPSRYYIRATGDNPLVDSEAPKRLYNYIVHHKLDYACEKGIPLGGGVEIFTKDALLKAFKNAVSSDDREHVTLFIKNNPHLFKISYVQVPDELNFPNLRVTVDYEADFKFVKSFLIKHYQGFAFKMTNIIDLLKKEFYIHSSE